MSRASRTANLPVPSSGLQGNALPSDTLSLKLTDRSHTYFELTDNILIVTYTRRATSYIAFVNMLSGIYYPLKLPINDIAYDAMQRVNGNEFLVVGATVDRAPDLYRITLEYDESLSRVDCRCICRSFDTENIPEGYLSAPTPFEYPRKHPKEANSPLSNGHAFLMLPANPHFEGLANTSPPCIILAHGGPTKHHRPSINLESQYMTSRGFAVVLLNHVGSTGYGNAYRDAMNGKWGVADVQDAVACVMSLAERNLIDANKVGVTGGSAGGYLTMQAMCTSPSTWAAGVSICGISDMAAFARDTHKFECHYDRLLVQGQCTSRVQGRADVYALHSPIAHAANLQAPLLLLQGTDDRVVCPNQAATFVRAVQNERPKARGNSNWALSVAAPIQLELFEQEGHGFHLAISKQRSLELQEQWWIRYLTSS